MLTVRYVLMRKKRFKESKIGKNTFSNSLPSDGHVKI